MAASQKILDFFTPERVKNLTGRPAVLSVDMDPIINSNDGFKFKNKEIDELKIDTVGACKYTDFVVALTMSD